MFSCDIAPQYLAMLTVSLSMRSNYRSSSKALRRQPSGFEGTQRVEGTIPIGTERAVNTHNPLVAEGVAPLCRDCHHEATFPGI